jgi:hypothetical protein
MRRKAYDYGRMMQRALRGVMSEVLGHVAKHGMKGDHHFFISFDTTHPGVDMPDWLRAQYPEDLAIVIQHEFGDLAVTNDRFSVVLSFNDKPATLVIPFDAVNTFADPSENFGLRFDAVDHEEPEEGAEPTRMPERPPARNEAEPEAPSAEGAAGDAEIVSLSDFRKR